MTIPPPAATEWDVVIDDELQEQVFPKAIVPLPTGILVLAQSVNYLVASDGSSTLSRVPGPGWYSPGGATRVQGNAGHFFSGQSGDSAGVISGANASVVSSTALAPNAAPGILFHGTNALEIVWSQGGTSRLSRFDDTGTDTWNRPLTLPVGVTTFSGFGVSDPSLAVAFAAVPLGSVEPCAVMQIDKPTGVASAGQPLASGTRTSECQLLPSPPGFVVYWSRSDDSMVFARVSASGTAKGMPEVQTQAPDGIVGVSLWLAGDSVVGVNGDRLFFLDATDFSRPMELRVISLPPAEVANETAVGSDGQSAYVAVRVTSPTGERVRLQKLVSPF